MYVRSTPEACYLFVLGEGAQHQPQGVIFIQETTRTHRYPVPKRERYPLCLATDTDVTRDCSCVCPFYAQVGKCILA